MRCVNLQGTCITTHLLTFKQKAPYKRFYYNKNNERRTLWKDLKI